MHFSSTQYHFMISRHAKENVDLSEKDKSIIHKYSYQERDRETLTIEMRTMILMIKMY